MRHTMNLLSIFVLKHLNKILSPIKGVKIFFVILTIFLTIILTIICKHNPSWFTYYIFIFFIIFF